MSHYEKLGVEKDASAEEIKKAYYKISKTVHPDKGGDPEEFKKINHAYEILSNPEKRQMYDMTGSDEESQGINMNDMFGGGNPFGFGGLGAMFGDMFGGMPGRGASRRAPRGPDKAQDIPLSLADFYNGRDIQIKFHQQRACTLCKASGALKTESCNGCRGAGVKMVMRQIGPGMIQQSVQKCSDCNGEGKRVLLVCHECSGKKYKTHEKALNARIEPGMPDGEKLRFVGECSDSSDYEKPGDVILNLLRSSSADSEFDWQGSDLHFTHSVEMAEALLGFHATVKDHPSGKEISLSWPGGPLQHDTVLVAKGLGMPIRGKKGEYGDLFMHIDIAVSAGEKKSGWTAEQRAALKLIFPEWTPPRTGGVPLNFQTPE